MRALQAILRAAPAGIGAALLALTAGAVAKAQNQFKTELTLQLGHSSTVAAVAFSPDGALFVSGSYDNTLKLWNVSRGQLLRTFEGHADGINSAVFTPDGTRLVSGSSDKTLKLWNVTSGQLLRTFEGHTDSVSSVALSPDGRRVVSGSWDKTLKLWDLASGQLLRSIQAHADNITSVAFSPDGKRLASVGMDRMLKLWDAESGRLLLSFEDTTRLTSVAFSPDGTRLASGRQDGTTSFRDSSAGQIILSFPGDRAAFAPGGSRVALLGSGLKAQVWDTSTGKLLRTFDGDFFAIAFSPDGNSLLLASSDQGLQLWDAGTGQLLQSFNGHAYGVNSAAFSPDATRLVSGGSDKTLKLWEAASGQLLRSSEAGTNALPFITRPDGWIVADPVDHSFEGHADAVTSVAFSLDGKRLVSGSADRTVKLWDAASGKILRTFKGHGYAVNSVAISPDGAKLLPGSDDKRIRLWDAASGQLLHTFEGHAAVRFAAFFSDGKRLISAGSDGSVKLWDSETGRLLHGFSIHGVLFSAALSPDGKRLLTGSQGNADKTALRVFYDEKSNANYLNNLKYDKTLKLWDVGSGQLLRSFEGQTDHVYSVAFSPDGTRILSGSNKALKLWDATSSQLLRSFEGHAGKIASAAFSADGKRILSASSDGTIRVWRADQSEPLAAFIGIADAGFLAITPAGFFTSSAHGDKGLLAVRGLQVTTIGQVHQSLFSPDLVREALAGDPDGEVKRAAEVINLDKVLDSGPAPLVEITSHPSGGRPDTDLAAVAARIKDRGKSIGRIEWRVNGITVDVSNAPAGAGPDYEVKRELALDPGRNAIEAVAYNASNLLASLPAQTAIEYTGRADAVKPNLHILAIGIDAYGDTGWTPPGTSRRLLFPPLNLAVADAAAFAAEIKKAAEGLYGEVRVRTALDTEATAAGLDRIVQDMSAQILPRDTFVLFAAAHGISQEGRFYLIPQDYQGGPNPPALASRAIGQERLQDWIANRIKAKKALILLDTCESGALVGGYIRSRVDAPASEAAVGRLHEATGRPVLTAAAAGQEALELTKLGHGVFTSALIDALHHGDSNGNGLIEVSELAAHVQDLVPKLVAGGEGRSATVARSSADEHQSAHFGSTGGDFALVKRLQ